MEPKLADIVDRLKSMLSSFGYPLDWERKNLQDAIDEIERLRRSPH
jgi:hypothetical protein